MVNSKNQVTISSQHDVDSVGKRDEQALEQVITGKASFSLLVFLGHWLEVLLLGPVLGPPFVILVLLPTLLVARIFRCSSVGAVTAVKYSQNAKRVYAIDFLCGTVLEINTLEKSKRVLARGFWFPHDIYVYSKGDGKETLFVADIVAGRLYEIDPAVKTSTENCKMVAQGIFSIARIALKKATKDDTSDKLIISASLQNKAYEFDLTTRATKCLKWGQWNIDGVDHALNGIFYVTVWPDGSLYYRHDAAEEGRKPWTLINNLFFPINPVVFHNHGEKAWVAVGEFLGLRINCFPLPTTQCTAATKSWRAMCPTGITISSCGTYILFCNALFGRLERINVKTGAHEELQSLRF